MKVTASSSRSPFSQYQKFYLVLLCIASTFYFSGSFALIGPVLRRSLVTPSLASLPLTNSNKAFNLRSSFLPANALNKAFSCTGLSCKFEKKNDRIAVRCEDSAVAVKKAEETHGKKFGYQVEVSRLLDLIVHCLYSHKEVFLRELVSNTSDALDKLKFLSVAEPALLGDFGQLEIRIKPDLDNGTVTITWIGLCQQYSSFDHVCDTIGARRLVWTHPGDCSTSSSSSCSSIHSAS